MDMKAGERKGKRSFSERTKF